MNIDLAMVLVLLAAAIAMFVRSRPRMDVVALIMIGALPLTGTVTVAEAIRTKETKERQKGTGK
jgi:di/tricarboxylate transporter